LILRLILTVTALLLTTASGEAGVQDAKICFATADRVASGEPVTEEEKRAAHGACQRALAETASIVQKYQLQESDFDIVGRPPKNEN
jgi:hypothetical protein